MKRTLRKAGVVALAAACVLALTAFLVVRFALPSRWPDDAIHVPRDASSLELALSLIEPGGVIVVRPDVADIVGPIVIDVADITLIAAGDVRVRGEGADPAITLRADGVTLRGLSVSGESVGLRIEGARCRLDGFEIQDATVGIQLMNARDCELIDVTVQGARIGAEFASARGNRIIRLAIADVTDVGVRLLESEDNTFEETVVDGAASGFSIEQASTENELTSCRIFSCSDAGIHVRSSSENSVIGAEIDGVAIGVMLEASTGCEIRECTISGCGDSGIRVEQSAQNLLIGNQVRDCQARGFDLVQSAENAISHNDISDVGDGAVWLERCDRSLLMANEIRSGGQGIGIVNSEGCRVLRNEIRNVAGVAIYMTGGGEHRLLDNEAIGGVVGLAVDASTDNTLLRNRIGVQRMEGLPGDTLKMLPGIRDFGVSLALIGDSADNHVGSNVFHQSDVGLYLDESARVDIVGNQVSSCDTGILLSHIGAGVRVEGNRIEENGVGLSFEAARSAEVVAEIPVIASNIFDGNGTADIENASDTTLYASGNWWGEMGDVSERDAALVLGVVSLEASAWRGTVAVGTETGTVHEILGRLTQDLLIGAGFRVIDLIGMGEATRVEQAVGARDVDLVWWGAPDEADVPTEDTMIEIPASRGWCPVVSAQLAGRLPEPTLSAVAELAGETGESFRLTAPRAVGHEAITAALDAYGLSEAVGPIDWTETQEEAEALLKFGVANVAVVDNLDETLTVSGFVALTDDLGALASNPIAVVLSADLVERHPELGEILSDLGEWLTTPILHDLIRRVRSLHLPARDVAREFLVRSEFLAD